MRRHSLLLALVFAAEAGARTITIEGSLAFVVCDDFKITHFSDNHVVISCVTPKLRLTITDCAKPKLVALSTGNFSLSC